MNFLDSVKETMLNSEFNESITENGAVGFASTGKALLDINFSVASLRSAPTNFIINKWVKAYYENPIYALRWLFFAGDIRGGLGERRLFRTIMTYICQTNNEVGKALLKLVPEYTRWDYVLDCIDDPNLQDYIIKDIIAPQFTIDCIKANDGEPISLLAKWLPSVNSKNKEVRRKALILCKAFNLSEKDYRKTLSSLRTYLNVVETKMCSGKWDEIDYSAVPSKANLRYANAFIEHDKERRESYLESLSRGETKINAGVLFPYDIVNKVMDPDYRGYPKAMREKDQAIIELWKALPDFVEGNSNTIVVADGSYSMTRNVGGSTTALNVANSLAIYFAEHQSGEFKDNYITFSSKPQFVNFSNCKDIYDKVNLALEYNECANTNIKAVFDLLLNTAVEHNMSQEDFVDNILIISDMEFDEGATGYSEKLFDEIAKDYEVVGLKLPRLIFWNVNSRTGAIPVIQNDLGVALVSGFSPVICKMVLSGKTDPYEVLIETISADRYDRVEHAVHDIIG